MQEPHYQIRPSNAKGPTRHSAKPWQRNRRVFELLKHLEKHWPWPGSSEAERQELQLQFERELRAEEIRQRLRHAEEKAQSVGDLRGPILPEQLQASSEIDLAIEALDVLGEQP